MRISDWEFRRVLFRSAAAWLALAVRAARRATNRPRSAPSHRHRAHLRIFGSSRARTPADRKSVVSGKSVSVRVDHGGRRILKIKQYYIRADTSEPHHKTYR